MFLRKIGGREDRGQGGDFDSVVTPALFILYKHTFGVGESVPLTGTTSMALLLSGSRKTPPLPKHIYLSFILC